MRGRPRSAPRGDSGRLPYAQQVAAREEADIRLARSLSANCPVVAQIFAPRQPKSAPAIDPPPASRVVKLSSAPAPGAQPKKSSSKKSKKKSKRRSKSRSGAKRGKQRSKDRRRRAAGASGS